MSESATDKLHTWPCVLIVDDDAESRKSIELLLRTIKVSTQSFTSGEELLAAFDPERPVCVILDLRMPGMSGLEVQQRLNEVGNSSSVIVITAYGEVPLAVRAMQAGALDFLEKPYSPQALLDRVQQALKSLSTQHEERATFGDLRSRLAALSPRETEVMRLLVQGKNTKSIAMQLKISDKTVDFHRRNLLTKMQVDSMVLLTRMLAQANVVIDDQA